MAYRNSKLQTATFGATGGGGTILNRLYGGAGPAINYVVRIELVERTAGAKQIEDSGSIFIEIPAAVAVGTPYVFTFGDGVRLAGDLIINGAGTSSGTVTYYAGL